MSLTERLDEQNARLAVLQSTEIELTEGADAALAILGPPSDPIRMRCALGILLRAERHQVAADLIGTQRIDNKWIDLAALVFAFLGDIERARLLVDQADNSPELPIVRSSRLAFAEGVFERWRQRFPNESFLAIRDWKPADVELARTIVELLDPLLASVRANRRIDGEYELGAVIFATYCSRMIGDQQVLTQCVNTLIRHVPLPLIVAELCLRGLVAKPPDGLPSRLRNEHPGNFQAGLLAALIERELLGQFKAAFAAVVQLSEMAATEDDKASVCGILFETCGQCGPEETDKAIEIVTRLCPADSRLLGHLTTIKHLTAGQFAAAADHVEAIRNEADGIWWETKAQLCEKLGESDAAQRAWEKASELLPHPDVVRRSIKASLDRKKFQSAVSGLAKLLHHDPKNLTNLRAMAFSLVQIGDHTQAAEYLSRLVELEPTIAEHRLHLAQSLARCARIEDAIDAIKPLCENDEPPLQALMLQSELLKAANKPGEAFDVLEKIASDHWDEPRFLLSYMHSGHAAGKDRQAHEAFARLLQLRREGKVPVELMQEGTIDQIFEFGKAFDVRRDSLQQAIIAGRMPWLFAEELLGNPPSWAWVLHTQPVKWLSEEPSSRAALSIYATNGFTVRRVGESKHLAEIPPPQPHVEVVSDLSALLTLHRLGRLEQAAEYFGCIILPSTLGDLRIRHADRFGQHQPSRESELKAILTEITRSRVHLLVGESQQMSWVEEYSESSDRHVFRLQDFIPLLESTQRVSPAAIHDLKRVAHRPASANRDTPALQLGDAILVDLMTLRTLASQAVFEAILDSFKVTIRESDRNSIMAELDAYETSRSAKVSHDALWKTVTDLASAGKVRWETLRRETDPEDSSDSAEANAVHLDAFALAQQLKKPFVVDDRVLQVATYQAESSSPSSACGSDAVLTGLLATDGTTLASIASDFHKLIQWRYRFLVPLPDILFAWAEEARDNLPGPSLIDAAVYFHDCLRDPGIHCGLEQSEPPMPMAARFTTGWIASIIQMLSRVWTEDSFDDAKCVGLTRWAGEELIPSCPRGLWYHQIGEGIEQAGRKSVFGMANVQFTAIQKAERANLALRTLAEAIGLAEDQYAGAVADAIRAMNLRHKNNDSSDEDGKLFSRIMLQNAMLHFLTHGIDVLSVAGLQELGLLKDVPVPEMPSGLLQTLQTRDYGDRCHLLPGPLVFIAESDCASVVAIDTILLNPDQHLRQAAFSYLKGSSSSSEPWVTPKTIELIAGHATDIGTDDPSRWRVAATAVAIGLRNDYFAHLAGLRQSIACNYQEGLNEYIAKVMHPRLSDLIYLRPPLWCASEQIEEIKSWCTEASIQVTLNDALSMHLNRCGYVPLSEDLGLPAVARLWMQEHVGVTCTWESLWTWALSCGSPFARYHAITIALHIPSLRPERSTDAFWKEIFRFVGLARQDEAEVRPDPVWLLHCALASHFASHIEGLHPRQPGERVACYAWWLSDLVCREIGNNELHAERFIERVLAPESEFARLRWTVARSPVTPSHFLDLTLNTSAMWSMSLVAQLGKVITSIPSSDLPPAAAAVIGNAVYGFVMANYFAERPAASARTFAFEGNESLELLCRHDGCVLEDTREALIEFIALRRRLLAIPDVQSTLAAFSEMPAHVQHVLLLVLKTAMYSTSTYDAIVAEWLEHTSIVQSILLDGPEYCLEPFLEMLAEFQQHQVGNWPLRLPHLLAYAVENAEDSARVLLIVPHILQMSHNCGIVSPIIRLVNANKWPAWPTSLATWRQNLVAVAARSEPWVAARVRATCATVSKLIGPRRNEIPDVEEASRSPDKAS